MKLDHIDVDVESSGKMLGFNLSTQSIPSNTCFFTETAGFVSLQIYLFAIRSANVLGFVGLSPGLL